MNRIKLTTAARAALIVLTMLLLDAPAVAAEPDLPLVVLVAPLEAGVNLHPPLVGEVVAETTATVGFQAAGRISERLVRRGERVEGGQLLARLDERDLAARVDSAQAELKQAHADAHLAEQELERSRQLFERKVGSRQALDQAISRQEVSASRVTSAAARLTEAENALGYVVLTAPFSGVVTGLFADVGDVMAVGQPVVRLAADDGRLVEVAVPERRRGDLAAQVQAQAQVQARLEADGVTVEAELDTISGAADPVSRSFAARYRLPPRAAGEAPWSLGQTATLLFATGD
ncbi:MAG TPA: efflux RND transporter periplasmic adaptor subunit, partial [Guyparkeria sp.]|nr:efflux RND transporter periplasmic adaptor subunit [Guyparkeria sp.]